MKNNLYKYLYCALSCLAIGAKAQSVDQNYIVTQLSNDNNNNTHQDNINYYDDLGRLQESVLVGDNTHKDIISLQEYDIFGRKSKSWLPGSCSLGNNGKFVDPNQLKLLSIDSNKDEEPFSYSIYENSPLDSVLCKFGPGIDWHNKNKAINMSYLTNNNDVNNQVIRFTYTPSSWQAGIYNITNSGYYASGVLNLTVINDEDGHINYLFRNMFGQIILKRCQIDDCFADTYYVYDYMNHIIAILPPLAVDNILVKGMTKNCSSDLGKYAYVYNYDYRGRLIESKIPGAEPSTFWYDNSDNRIFTKDPNGNIHFEISDELGRVCIAGICSNSLTKSDFNCSNKISTVKAIRQTDHGEGYFYGYKIEGINLIRPKITLVNYYDDYSYFGDWEAPSYVNDGFNIRGQLYLTNIADNNTEMNKNIQESKFITRTDNQKQDQMQLEPEDPGLPLDPGDPITPKPSEPKKPVGPLKPIDPDNPSGGASSSTDHTLPSTITLPFCKGFLTGKLTALLKDSVSNKMIYSSIYYDHRLRPIFTFESDQLGGFCKKSLTYNYRGKVISCNDSIVPIDGNKNNINILKYKFTYDNRDRLLKETLSYNDKAEQQLYSCTYDDLGRLSSRQQSQSQNSKSSYCYNVRGQLTSLNSPLFKENLYYNKTRSESSNPCYGGGISSIEYGYMKNSQSISQLSSYDYHYDAFDRITQADYRGQNGNQDAYYTHYKYDKQGNITNLQRNNIDPISKEIIAVDDAQFNYDGNQITDYQDDGQELPTSDISLPKNNDSPVQFSYDKAGNMTANINKGIIKIDYNILNLPYKVYMSNGNMITYIYRADGKKTSAEYGTYSCNISIPKTGLMTKTLTSADISNYKLDYKYDYVDDGKFQFNTDNQSNLTLNYIHTDGLLIKMPKSASPNYYYEIADHQGNIRYIAQDGITYANAYEYYPFGGTFNSDQKGVGTSFRYNGKELESDDGVDWYDYSARRYDPALGRFTSIDPLASKCPNLSPYAYCMNDPINQIDRDGKFSSKFWANISRWWYNCWHVNKAQPVTENKDAVDKRFLYTYTVGKPVDGVCEIKAYHKIDTSAAETLQNVGDGVALVGYSVTLTGVGAEIGLPTAEIGNLISETGAILGMGINLVNGDYGESLKSASFYLLSKGLDRLLEKSLPGYGKKFGDKEFNLGTETIRQGKNLKVSGAERLTNDIQKKKEEDKK